MVLDIFYTGPSIHQPCRRKALTGVLCSGLGMVYRCGSVSSRLVICVAG